MRSPAFERVLQQIEKDYGQIFRQATGKSDQRKVPLGVFQIDRLLKGGLPVNRLSLICGHKGSFKTTLALKAIKNWQDRCGACLRLRSSCACPEDKERPEYAVFIDMEHALDEGQEERLGLDTSRLYIFRPPHGEAACEYTEKLAKVPDVGLIVLDSLAALVPADELNAKSYFSSVSRALRARLIARMLRALIINIDSPDVPKTAIMLNHLLPNLGGYGDVLPGGEEQEYLSSVVLKVWLTGRKKIFVGKGGEEEIVLDEDNDKKATKVGLRKQKVGFLIKNSKVTCDYLEGEFSIYLEDRDGIRFGDADDIDLILLWAKKTGLMQEDGKGWTLLGETFSTQKAAAEHLRENRDRLEELKQKIIETP